MADEDNELLFSLPPLSPPEAKDWNWEKCRLWWTESNQRKFRWLGIATLEALSEAENCDTRYEILCHGVRNHNITFGVQRIGDGQLFQGDAENLLVENITSSSPLSQCYKCIGYICSRL